MSPVVKSGLHPVRLPDTPMAQGPVPLSGSAINLRVCEFAELYEAHLQRTLTKGTHLVQRWVLEDESVFAALIPNCPPVADHASLPTDEIDCVASILEVPSNFWARGCYVLRLRAVPHQISFELYVCAVPTLVGAVPMQFRTMGHALTVLGDNSEAARARQEGPPLKQAMEHAQLKSQRYQVLVMKAVEAALMPPRQQNTPAPVGSVAPVQAQNSQPPTPSAPPPVGSPAAAPPPRRRRT